MRLQMLQVARLAQRPLGTSAESVAAFIRSRQHESGGFVDRGGQPDLYYTVFGIDCLIALSQQPPVETIRPYLESFGAGDELDLVHLASLARCWSALDKNALPSRIAENWRARIAGQRTSDGGYNVDRGAKSGSAYGCFLAAGAAQDIGDPIPDPDGLVRCLERLHAKSGGYANEPGLPVANVPATAAAVTLLQHLGQSVPQHAVDFLLSCFHAEGGFFALPGAPMPDLLSTAVALHALSAAGRSPEAVKEPCLDFIDTLWSAKGSFYGTWAEEEEALDVEYTWYGLLALGHLSL